MPPTPITFLITDLHLGGTPLLLRDLALGLRDHNLAPTLISLKPLPIQGTQALRHKGTKAEEDPPTPLVPQCLSALVPSLAAAHIPIHSLNLTSLTHLPHALTKLIKILKHQQPNILYSMLIHANALATAALPFLRPRPLFLQSLHTLQETPRWHWTLQGKIARFADALIVPAQPILDRIPGPFHLGKVIPNGIHPDRFANALPPPPAEVPWPIGTPIIGYVGRFDPVKNLPLLLHAFAALHGGRRADEGGQGADSVAPRLALVGYGPQEETLRNLAISLHIAPLVHFLGPTTTPEKYYKSFSLLCLPSAVEGFGLPLVEAMAAGIPVVALKTPVTASIVRDGIDGHLVESTPTPESLAHALQEVIATSAIPPHGPTDPQNPSLLRVREHFSVGGMVDAHAEFFKNLLSARR